MNSFSRFLAVSFAGLFILGTGLAFVFYNVEQSVFDAELYIRAFEKENLYQRLPDLTAQALSIAAQKAESDDPLVLLRNLSEDEWKTFMEGLFPPAQLRILAEDTIRQIMAYLNGKSDSVAISLTSLKNHMISPQGINAIYDVIKSQPDCTAEQLAAIALGQQDMVLCNPPETFLLFDLQPLIEAEIKAVVLSMPEQVVLITTDFNSTKSLRDLNNLRTILRISPIIPMMCLLMITVITVRSFSDWLNWWGYPLWLAGLFSMGLIIISGPLTNWMFQTFVVPVFSEALPLDIQDMLKDIVTTIAFDAVLPTARMAGLLIFIGLSMVAIAFIFRKKFNKDQVEA